MLTKRDREIIAYLEKFKIASTTNIKNNFFSNDQVCRRRLKYLYDNKFISRQRDNINNEYLYYINKPPKQIRHSLYVTKFYDWLLARYDVKNFEIEKNLGDIRPDAVFSYLFKDQVIDGCLEVELSKKGLNQGKYERFILENNYMSYFTRKPFIVIVTDGKVTQGTNVKFFKIDLEKLK